MTQTFFKKFVALAFLSAFLFTFLPSAHAVGEKEAAVRSMRDRQINIQAYYDNLDTRVKDMDRNNPRRDPAKDLLKIASDAVDAFYALSPDDHLTGNNQPDQVFLDAEEEAIKKINAVNRYLFAPVLPGAKDIAAQPDEESVPHGDIIEDFIPQFIRLLMRFASLAVFVSFVVSGVMFVIAFGNEDRVTKAKRMLYWTLIGFAFVTLAFALIKAVTDIDFFGFM